MCYPRGVIFTARGEMEEPQHVRCGSNKNRLRTVENKAWPAVKVNTGTRESRMARNRRSLLACTLLLVIMHPRVAIGEWVKLLRPDGTTVNRLIARENVLYAGTENDIIVSTDAGAHWSIAATRVFGRIWDLADDARGIVAGKGPSVLVQKVDDRTSWTVVSMENIFIVIPFENPTALLRCGSTLFVGTTQTREFGAGGIYRSPDNGTTWIHVRNGPSGCRVNAFAARGREVLAATASGIFSSSDNGVNWKRTVVGLSWYDVKTLVSAGQDFFAGLAQGGVVRSTDNGATWTPVNRGLPDAAVVFLAAAPRALFASVPGRGVFMTTDRGAMWVHVSRDLPDSGVAALAVSGTYLFVGAGSDVWKKPLAELIHTDHGGTRRLLQRAKR